MINIFKRAIKIAPTKYLIILSVYPTKSLTEI